MDYGDWKRSSQAIQTSVGSYTTNNKLSDAAGAVVNRALLHRVKMDLNIKRSGSDVDPMSSPDRSEGGRDSRQEDKLSNFLEQMNSSIIGLKSELKTDLI